MSHYRNAFRYQGQPRWFDFYNCRIVLPEQDLFFFAVPYILSGDEISPDARGLYVYDGGNGGPSGISQVCVERIGHNGWSASDSGCDFQWSKPGRARNFFTEQHLSFAGPSTVWDIRIEPFLGDRQAPISDRRRFDLEERLVLERVPFIHRVPRMKAFASGVIEQQGRRHVFERAIAYQAKNHGRGYPDDWNWIHANAFAEDTDFAFEAAWLQESGGTAGIVRVVRPDEVRVLTSWQGDRLDCGRDGDTYWIDAESKDGVLQITGRAKHRENIEFRFPAPDGRQFVNDESLVGELTVTVGGSTFSTRMAALGRAHISGSD